MTVSLRPPVLYTLFGALSSLPRVGDAMAKRLEKACGGKRVWDLASHRPVALIVRQPKGWLSQSDNEQVVMVQGVIAAHHPPMAGHQPYKIRMGLPNGQHLTLGFFRAKPDWLLQQYPMGETRVVSGKLEATDFGFTILHPDYAVPPEQASQIPKEEMVYPLSAGITNKQMRFLVQGALERVPVLPEWLEADFVKRKGWLSWREALVQLHQPKVPADLLPFAPARQRLAFDELLAQQLGLAMRRQQVRKHRGRSFTGNGRIASAIRQALPFTLTAGQEQALQEIGADLASPERMLRLLQGDVGSGKTVLAFLAAAAVLESGAQVALMAPTDLLARQHLHTLKPWAEAAGVRLGLMTGNDRKKERQETLARLADGSIHCLIGTHALLEDTVQFHDLGLVIVDEQHRFGVHQRLTLSRKGRDTDMLMMTATPIPRTLLLALAGDMDVTRLSEKPPGRKPVQTTVMPSERLEELVARLLQALDEGASIYWVCPLVEESEQSDLAAATARYESLRLVAGERVGLVHGRLKAAEKEAAVQAFTSGETPLLVATTVIEVGVNVPNATIMVIEHAERFGLAQLHQLRGRVGRGDKEGVCVLLYYQPLGQIAKARLSMMRQSNDGFVLAEEDLRLRGAGDVLGTVQSGLPPFRFVDWEAHQNLLAEAHDYARLLLERNSRLEGASGEALQVLLHLCGYQQAEGLLAAG